MEFELNEDQRMFREAAREFASERLAPLAQEFDEKEEISPEIYKELSELGYLGMMLPEEYGGSGMDFQSYILVMEEFAKACAALEISISVHNSLVCHAIYSFGTEEQKKKYLPKLAKGELFGAYSLTEPTAGTDAGSLKTTAVLKNELWGGLSLHLCTYDKGFTSIIFLI